MSRSTLRVGAVLLGLIFGATVAGVFTWAVQTQSYNVWGAILVIPAVVAVNALLIWRVAAGAPERWLAPLLGGALIVKVLGAFVRYIVAFVVYGGVADAAGYNLYAASHYAQWRQGYIVWEWVGKQGTQFMELITTAVYTVIGPSPLAGFVVFASFAFWGQYFLYRAFRVAVPYGDARRYAVLVFFLPSMLYWPSSIGKESWLLLFVGITALGAARFFTHARHGLRLLALGAFGTAIVRPHVAVLLFAALLTAQLFRPTRIHSRGLASKLGGILVLGAAAWVLTTQSASFLGIDDLSWQAVSESVDGAASKTDQGGSAFQPVPLGSPWGVAAAVVTVLFRPLPWEASNVQMLGQSLEGMVLIALTMKAWPAFRRLWSRLKRTPYLLFCVVYTSVFIAAFSGFGNFGILARQRVLMLPFFLVLLALPRMREERSVGQGERELHHARR